MWASPVAGVFLCVAAVAMLAGARLARDTERADWRTALALGGPAVVGGLAMAVLFPEGGSDHFTGTAFWPMLLVCLGALALVDPSRRTAIWAAAIYVAVLVAAFAIPNSLGQNALRPGVVLGPALLVLFARPRAPRAAVAVIAVALLYLQWLPAVRAVEEARGDPSTAAAFHEEVLRLPRAARAARRAPGGAAHAQPLGGDVPRAGLPARARLAPAARPQGQPAVLRPQAPAHGGALPALAARERGALGRAADRAARLLGADRARRCCSPDLPYLEPVHASAHWRIWEVRDPEPPVSGAARLPRPAPTGSTWRRRGPAPVIVRQHRTPYWTVVAGDGCVSEDRASGWTRVDVAAPAWSACAARFSAAGALRQRAATAPRRTRPGRPTPGKCGQPPCHRTVNTG